MSSQRHSGVTESSHTLTPRVDSSTILWPHDPGINNLLAAMNMHGPSRMPDQQQFVQLLEPNLRALNRFVLGIVGNPFDADDIVQETVTKAFVHFGNFRAESKFKTWLMSIAINEVRSRRRSDFRSRLTYFDFGQLERLSNSSGDSSPLQQYHETENAQLVERAIRSLHPTYKQMIQLRAIDGLNVSDAASKLSISVSAVKARYYRAVQRLSETLERQTRQSIRKTIERRGALRPEASQPVVLTQ